MDEDTLAMVAGVQLAALPQEQQLLLLDVMAKNALETVSLKQAEKLAVKQEEQQGLDAAQIQAILLPTKSHKQPVLRIKFERLQDFFTEDQTTVEIEQEIITALEYYRQNGGTV